MSVKKVASSRLPTKYGDFDIHGFRGPNGEELIVLTVGDVSGENTLLRVHSACLTGDTFHSRRCDCGNQLEISIRNIMDDGRGIIIYLPYHEGRGIGILNKIKAYKLQDNGRDTVDANLELGFECDLRDYSLVPEILEHFKIKSVRLMTNNPQKIRGLEKNRIKVKRVPIIIPADKISESYIETKKKRMGHLFE